MDNPLRTSNPQTIGNPEDFGYYRGIGYRKSVYPQGIAGAQSGTFPQVPRPQGIAGPQSGTFPQVLGPQSGTFPQVLGPSLQVMPQPVARYKLTKFQMALCDIMTDSFDLMDLMNDEDTGLIEFIDNNNSPNIRQLFNVPLLEDSVTVNYIVDTLQLLPQVRVTYTRDKIKDVRGFLKAVGEFYDSPLTKEQLLDIKIQDTPDDDESPDWPIFNWANTDSYKDYMYQLLASEPVYNSLLDMKGTLTSVMGFNITLDGSYHVELERVTEYM